MTGKQHSRKCIQIKSGMLWLNNSVKDERSIVALIYVASGMPVKHITTVF